MKKEPIQSVVHGDTAPGFEEVRQTFNENINRRRELGGAVGVYYRGQRVVDLWGGVKDVKIRQPRQEDTLCSVFSTTKGVTAFTIAKAVSMGILDYDALITNYWPEFGQNGKDRITLRQLLAHQAGLSKVDESISFQTLTNPDELAVLLARQKPSWTPGQYQEYHCWMQGFYLSEILRRADPQKRRLGQFFRDEMAVPLDLDFYIGLPAQIPDERLANLLPFHPVELLFNMDKMPMGMVLALVNPNSLSYRSLMNPPVCAKHANFNRRDMRSVEIPSGNGMGTARAIAKLYSEFATGGKTLGINPKVIKDLEGPAIPPYCGHFSDLVFKMEMPFSLGLWKPWDKFLFGSSRSYGVWGAGGSCGFADPACQLGFAYVSNKMGLFPMDDPREHALRTSVYECIRRLE